MGEFNYCPSCGNEDIDCSCDIDGSLDEYLDGAFRWEYQHEGCSYYGTVFKKVMPDSDS